MAAEERVYESEEDIMVREDTNHGDSDKFIKHPSTTLRQAQGDNTQGDSSSFKVDLFVAAIAVGLVVGGAAAAKGYFPTLFFFPAISMFDDAFCIENIGSPGTYFHFYNLEHLCQQKGISNPPRCGYRFLQSRHSH